MFWNVVVFSIEWPSTTKSLQGIKILGLNKEGMNKKKS